ncbi:MAG: amidohydrolase family protein [Dorea sp.]|nr:amidohydrolase family protein [Dorea sp.]
MIDAHIHFSQSMGAERLKEIIKEMELEAIALLCIPKGGAVPVEEDAFAFRSSCDIPVYIFGGLSRSIYRQGMSVPEFAANADAELSRLLALGCTGIKMLEGKPDVRKAFAVPDFDSEFYDLFFNRLEREQIPLIFHVNDPEEFWDSEHVADYVKKAGWFYDSTFINNEEQYAQILRLLANHPNLKVLFPHFFFLSNRLERLAEILERYPNVRIDLTPGIELYYNLSSQQETAKQFINRYQKRIIYGTDIGARTLIRTDDVLLSLEECRSRVSLIRNFLETRGDYLLTEDGYYVVERKPTVMHGLGLSDDVLENIYRQNFLDFIRKN